ncbi:SpoIIE family protein phosphatase [Streptomyces sp. NPDC003393]
MNSTRAKERQSPAEERRTAAEVECDERGLIIRWSTEAEALLGFTSADMRGQPVTILAAPDERRTLADRGHAGDRMLAPVIRLCRKDGRTRECRVLVHPSARNGGWTVLMAPAAQNPDTHDVDAAVLEALFSQSPVSLCVYDPDLHLRRYNPAALGKQGIFSQQSLGLRPHEVWPESNAGDFEVCMAEVLRSGIPHIGFEKRGHPPDDPDNEHVFTNSAFRLNDREGHILGLATTSVEITEQRVAEERIALLAEASTLIGTSLDVMRTGQQLADITVPRFADATAVDVLAPVIAGEEPDASVADLRRIGLRHTGTARADSDARARHLFYPYPPSAAERLSDPQPRRMETVLPGYAGEPLDRGAGQPAHALVAPLCARGVVLGLVTFYRLGHGNSFSDFDVLTVRDLASRAALAIDNARRYLREHGAARTLQRSLLPRRFPQRSAVETAHYFAPTASRADWFDVIPVSSSRVVLVMGTTGEPDVAGAAAIGRLGAAVQTLADMDLAADEVLARLHALATRIAGERSPDTEPQERSSLLTETAFVYAVYDPVSGRLTLASAGHPLPVVATPDGSAQAVALSPGVPLGTGDDFAGSVEVDLPTGSTLAFYTPTVEASDGLAADDVPPLLRAAISSVGEAPVEHLMNEAVAGLAGASTQGALLLVRTRRLDEEDVATWELPSDPAVVGTARSLAARQLDTWGLEEASFVTEMVVSELVTNAIRYARGPVHLRLIRDRVLTCEVSDATTTAPHLRYARAGDEGGRGLYLVAELTRRWGTRFSKTGKTIWTEQIIRTAAT